MLVYYEQAVRRPKAIAGKESEIRDLPDYLALRLVREGIVRVWTPPPASPPKRRQIFKPRPKSDDLTGEAKHG